MKVDHTWSRWCGLFCAAISPGQAGVACEGDVASRWRDQRRLAFSYLYAIINQPNRSFVRPSVYPFVLGNPDINC